MTDTESATALRWMARNLAWSQRLAELRVDRARTILVAVEAFGPSARALPAQQDRVA